MYYKYSSYLVKLNFLKLFDTVIPLDKWKNCLNPQIFNVTCFFSYIIYNFYQSYEFPKMNNKILSFLFSLISSEIPLIDGCGERRVWQRVRWSQPPPHRTVSTKPLSSTSPHHRPTNHLPPTSAAMAPWVAPAVFWQTAVTVATATLPPTATVPSSRSPLPPTTTPSR